MTTQPVKATITGDRVTIVLDNRFRSFLTKSEQGQRLIEAIKKDPQDLDEIRQIADIAAYVAAHSFGRVILDDRDQLRLDGQVVDYGIAPMFKRVLAEGLDVTPLARFLENVAENPDKSLAQHLYPFLVKGHHPLTDDGCFLAFKRVDDDYWSFSSGSERVWSQLPGEEPVEYVGKVRYPIGSRIWMGREDCDPSRQSACSTGLHVCSFDYLTTFHGGSGRILIVKVNPKNVTAFPYDHEAKMRVCELESMGEIPEADAREHFTSAVDRRYGSTETPVETPPAEPELSWYDRGRIGGEAEAREDTENASPYSPMIDYPSDCVEAADRADFSEGWTDGYREVYGVEDDDDAPEPELDDEDESDHDTAWTVASARSQGDTDGRLWAKGDTSFDPDFQCGEFYDTIAAADDGSEDLLNAYKQGFVGGYTEQFKSENPDT